MALDGGLKGGGENNVEFLNYVSRKTNKHTHSLISMILRERKKKKTKQTPLDNMVNKKSPLEKKKNLGLYLIRLILLVLDST